MGMPRDATVARHGCRAVSMREGARLRAATWMLTCLVSASLTVAGPSASPAGAGDLAPTLVAQAAGAVETVGGGPEESGPGAGAMAVDPAADKDFSYDPSGRRDPFNPLIQSGENGADRHADLPPLQRVGLTEINLIGIIWGGFGYTAMVQTPDGKGYAVRRGTRIGPNNGMVTKITENSLIVIERYTDIYGKEQEREYVKLLHPSEESE